MFCAGLAMVRNEADAIELWARYNDVRVLDSPHAVDHGSQDNTVEVREQLQAEGLPITLHRWHDADELRATDRATLHTALPTLAPGHAPALRWRITRCAVRRNCRAKYELGPMLAGSRCTASPLSPGIG